MRHYWLLDDEPIVMLVDVEEPNARKAIARPYGELPWHSPVVIPYKCQWEQIPFWPQ